MPASAADRHVSTRDLAAGAYSPSCARTGPAANVLPVCSGARGALHTVSGLASSGCTAAGSRLALSSRPDCALGLPHGVRPQRPAPHARRSCQAQALGGAPAARADVHDDKLLNNFLRGAAGREGGVVGPASAALPHTKQPHSDRACDAAGRARARSTPRVCGTAQARCLHQRTPGVVAQRERGQVPRRRAQSAACACRAAGRARRTARRSARRRTPGVSKGARPCKGEVWHDIRLLHSPQDCARLSRPARAWQSPRDLTAHALPRCAWCQVTLRAQAAPLARRGGRAAAGTSAPGPCPCSCARRASRGRP